MTRKLRVYECDQGDTDWVVAYSPEDAASVLNETLSGVRPEDIKLCTRATLRIRNDDGTREERTLEEWAAINGRGHLCCTYD